MGGIGAMKSRMALGSFFILASLLLQPSQAVYVPPRWNIKGISPKDTPQFILLTHDDNTDEIASTAVTEITRQHSNPNGCKINAAFFSTSSLSDCKYVKALWNIGHEIATHTMSHKDLHDMSFSEKKKEIVGARDWLASCGVPKSHIVGHRSPFLSDDPDVRKILSDNGYHYDSSIGEVFDSPTSPSATKRLFPYTMDKGVAQLYSCKWYSNINHCTKSEKHPGLMEIPLYMYQSGPNKPSSPNLMDPVNPYKVLAAEFKRNYLANRAPIGIWSHTSTGHLKKKVNREQISKFLRQALSKPDVWVVTPRQLSDYMKNPVPASKMNQFMSKYKCSREGIPRLSWK